VTARAVSFEPPKQSDWRDLALLLTSTGLPTGGLEHHLATTLVARDGGGIVGSVALEVYGADALLRSLAVSRERRNEGLGQSLTASALDLARSRGVERVYLLTETAASFFRRLGFRDVARADMPEGIRGSLEFARLCPASAETLVLVLPGR
jgi:amino-acid N-acetyltransferase